MKHQNTDLIQSEKNNRENKGKWRRVNGVLYLGKEETTLNKIYL